MVYYYVWVQRSFVCAVFCLVITFNRFVCGCQSCSWSAEQGTPAPDRAKKFGLERFGHPNVRQSARSAHPPSGLSWCLFADSSHFHEGFDLYNITIIRHYKVKHLRHCHCWCSSSRVHRTGTSSGPIIALHREPRVTDDADSGNNPMDSQDAPLFSHTHKLPGMRCRRE